MMHLAGQRLQSRSERVIHVTRPKTLSYVLKGLEIYAVYRIKIRAFTVKGDGVSTEISAGNILVYNWLTVQIHLYRYKLFLSYYIPSYPTLSFLVLHYPTVYPSASYRILSYPVLSHPTLPYLIPPYPTRYPILLLFALSS